MFSPSSCNRHNWRVPRSPGSWLKSSPTPSAWANESPLLRLAKLKFRCDSRALGVGSHVTCSVGSEAEAQLLVKGTDLVQHPSPVQPVHRAPDLHGRTGMRSCLLVCTYAGVLFWVSCPPKKGKRSYFHSFAREARSARRVLDFKAILRGIHPRAQCRIHRLACLLRHSGVAGRTGYSFSLPLESCFSPFTPFALRFTPACLRVLRRFFWGNSWSQPTFSIAS